MLQFQKSREKKKRVGQTSLGFKEQSKLSIWGTKLQRRFKLLNQEVRYSGILNNFWLWNIVFLHIAVAIVLSLLLFRYYHSLPNHIGVTLDNIRRFDRVLPKDFLYILIVFHGFSALCTVCMSLRAEKRLNHLFIASFFNFAVLAFYEFFALRDFIFYFL